MLIYKILYNTMVYFQLYTSTLGGQVGTFENYQEACQTNLYSETSIRKHSRFHFFPFFFSFFFFAAPKFFFKPIVLVSCWIILLCTLYWSLLHVVYCVFSHFIKQCFSMQKNKEKNDVHINTFILWLLHVIVYICQHVPVTLLRFSLFLP